MFHVEEMTPKDFPFAVKLANTMDWNMTTEDFEFNAKLEPHGCFVLLDGAEQVGIATCISYGLLGWFGNLIVKEAYRRRGAGTLLVQQAMSYLHGLGVKTIGLYAYPHLVDFYTNLGFRYNSDFSVLKADKVSCVETLRLKAAAKQDMPALLDLDGECFGASRRKLLEQILLRKNSLCYVSTENDEIAGFAVAKIYPEMAELGPLICRRKRMDLAVELLQEALGKLKGLEVWLCAPTAETTLLDTAFKAGFREEFKVARMFLGSAVAGNCLSISESLERG
jgi:ribosomal protein S18 acetylase RimI-like enzyme